MTLLLFLLLPLVIMFIAMRIQANTLVVEEKKRFKLKVTIKIVHYYLLVICTNED